MWFGCIVGIAVGTSAHQQVDQDAAEMGQRLSQRQGTVNTAFLFYCMCCQSACFALLFSLKTSFSISCLVFISLFFLCVVA